jgi:phosphotransferase system enzyme I (PtsI)
MDAQQLLESAMNLTTAEEIERYIRTEMERRFTGLT